MNTNQLSIELLKRGFKESELKAIATREELTNRQCRKLVKRARSMQGLYSRANVMIGRMTNFQRLHWERAGRPMDEEGILFFMGLTKDVFEQAQATANLAAQAGE